MNSKYHPEMGRLIHSFPPFLKEDVETVLEILPSHANHLFSNDLITVNLKGALIQFPGRIYFDEPNPQDEFGLTTLQKAILDCIFSRHHNGFIRQRRLESLSGKRDFFIIPFVVQLLAEYVKEILVVVDQLLNEDTIYEYKAFTEENKKYWQSTQSRVISYWNEYYRYPNCRKIDDYIGKQIMDRINKTNA